MGFIDFFESGFRSDFIFGDIRMVFPGELAERFFDVRGTGLTGDTEDGVIVFEIDGHGREREERILQGGAFLTLCKGRA